MEKEGGRKGNKVEGKTGENQLSGCFDRHT
jgi:hypothetical protein